ncbi:MAG TPA: nuclease-related domain-containing protein [Marmoricola sp.]
MAGESAREVARKRREKAERLTRLADAFERGAAGEEETARCLKGLPRGWRVINDVRWPGRRYANIDHVVVGPTGVYVIDSKLWSGTITVINGVLRQNGYKRETAVAGVADAAIAVAQLVPGMNPYLVKPVLCFVREQEFGDSIRDVLVCSTSNLVSTLTSQELVLDDTAINNVHGWLAHSLKSASPMQAEDWPPPPPRTPPRSPSRTRAPKRPRAHQGKAGAPILKSCLVGLLSLVLLLVGVGLVVNFLGSLGGAVERPVTAPPPESSESASTSPLGTATRFAHATGRPPLRVVVDRAGTTRSTQGLRPILSDYRLFAVRLRIKDIGGRRWVSQPGTIATVSDSLGVPHRATSRYREVKAGQAFPDVIRLKPGRSMRRVFVFEVPVDEAITSFALTVGPGKPETATWVIDHQ